MIESRQSFANQHVDVTGRSLPMAVFADCVVERRHDGDAATYLGDACFVRFKFVGDGWPESFGEKHAEWRHSHVPTS